MADVLAKLKNCVTVTGGRVRVTDGDAVRGFMDSLIYEAVFNADEEKRKGLQRFVIEIAKQMGAIPASIQSLYEEMGRNYPGFTVPAINIRGLTYDTAKVIFRKALEKKVGAMIFEIARSEIGYTNQRPLEYSAAVLAAAVKEGYRGPVFMQGDHFQTVRKYYLDNPKLETDYVKGLIREAIDAEFYNIDLDTSTLVDLDKKDLREEQRPNFQAAADLAAFIRDIEPKGVTVSIGGEIGEIGGKNSTPEELRAYLDGFRETMKSGKGVSKLSVQSGTSHGGVVLPDGSLAQVKIDFDTLKKMSDVARKEYGLSGAVQHGASTLPDNAFHKFPETGTSEVHLATGFQNIMYDSPALPAAFRDDVYRYIKENFAKEKKESQTEEQFIYSTRKKGFGPLKQKWWDLPDNVKGPIMKELSDKFELLFHELKVNGSRDLVDRTVKPVVIDKTVPEKILD
ncbi:MAG: class II fructose-bisphosphate aldolase [Nitrospiraceae bacterium]|nr:MAG: class II fructose-bisphosphate aldolase [Nitrospiraceae bacterium]